MKKKVLRQQQPTSKYKSKFESQFADNLTKKKIIFTYETLSIDYEITCTYRPDFILNNFIVETKGYFSKEDRRKHLAIKEKRPDLDIRFCFQNSKAKLSRGKRSLTYGAWATKHGFLWSHGSIPTEWMNENQRKN